MSPTEDDPVCGNLSIAPELGGGDFFRYTIAELFGASLVGKHPLSAAIFHYRQFVAKTRSDIVLAADDSLCLILPACTLNDTRILLEFRKRYVAAIQHMRTALQAGVRDPESLLACAVEFLFHACFQPLASDVASLYDGVVQLARANLSRLRTLQTPLNMGVLVQIRHTVFFRSLATETPLPLDIKIWQDLPALSGLLPEITESLMQLAIYLPNYLATAREAEDSPWRDLHATETAITNLLTLEGALVQWQTKYCTHPFDAVIEPRSQRPRRELAMSSEDRLRNDIGLSAENSHLSLHCQALCHICLLLLRRSVATLSVAENDEVRIRQYLKLSTETADALCQLTTHLLELSSGHLEKALSAWAPLYFTRQWFESDGDSKGLAWVSEQEARLQKEVPWVSWQAVLSIGMVPLWMHG